jgi:hypothetical protein
MLKQLMNEEQPTPIVGVVNGKWSFMGEPIERLEQHERNFVFQTIANAMNVDQDKTSSLKF